VLLIDKLLINKKRDKIYDQTPVFQKDLEFN